MASQIVGKERFTTHGSIVGCLSCCCTNSVIEQCRISHSYQVSTNCIAVQGISTHGYVAIPRGIFIECFIAYRSIVVSFGGCIQRSKSTHCRVVVRGIAGVQCLITHSCIVISCCIHTNGVHTIGGVSCTC